MHISQHGPPRAFPIQRWTLALSSPRPTFPSLNPPLSQALVSVPATCQAGSLPEAFALTVPLAWTHSPRHSCLSLFTSHFKNPMLREVLPGGSVPKCYPRPPSPRVSRGHTFGLSPPLLPHGSVLSILFLNSPGSPLTSSALHVGCQ